MTDCYIRQCGWLAAPIIISQVLSFWYSYVWSFASYNTTHALHIDFKLSCHIMEWYVIPTLKSHWSDFMESHYNHGNTVWPTIDVLNHKLSVCFSLSNAHMRTRTQKFMEPGSSLLYLQEPTTCPYPEPDYSSLCHCILFLREPLRYHLHLGLPSGLVSSGCLTKTLYAVLFPPYMSCTLPISYDHLNNTGWRVQILKLLHTQFCPVWCYFSPPKGDNMSQLISDILLYGCMCTVLLPQYAFTVPYFFSVFFFHGCSVTSSFSV